VHGEVSTRGRAACRLTSLPRRQAAKGRRPARMETWPGTHAGGLLPRQAAGRIARHAAWRAAR